MNSDTLSFDWVSSFSKMPVHVDHSNAIASYKHTGPNNQDIYIWNYCDNS